jgi:hypothetical protein
MQNNKNTITRSPSFAIILLSLIVAVLNSCVLSPIYVQIESNIAFEYTLLPIILNYAVLIFDTIYISLLVASLSYSVFGIHSGVESKKLAYVYTIAIVVTKHVVNLVVSSLIDGYIDVGFDVPMVLYSIGIDLLLLAIVATVANHVCKLHFARVKTMMKASKYLETVEYGELDDVYPFKGFFRIKRNPLLVPAITGAIISSFLLIIQRLFADFVVLGAPSNFIEIIDIFLSYIGDVLFGLISYTVSYFSLSYIMLQQNAEK